MKDCIINYSEGGWYPRGQARLIDSLRNNDCHFKGDLLFFNKVSAEGCPTHQESPYAFKYWAFNHAKEKGYENVLWLDSSFWAIKPLDELFKEIQLSGYVLQRSFGFKLGVWCSDNALRSMKLSREEAFKLVMPDGGLIGLNMTNIKALNFLKQMTEYSLDGITFQGNWKNDKQQVSKDPRVLGHRHDMSISTVVAEKLNMESIFTGKYWVEFAQYSNYPKVCLLGQGM